MTDLNDPSGLNELQRFGLGAIDQISFAVASVDDAEPRYAAMFGGPFLVIDVPDLAVIVEGEAATADLRLGFGRSGSIEVELVEVVAGPWPTRTWLAEHGEGLHHVRFPVPDVASSRAAMEAEGFHVTMEAADHVSFVYLESPLLNGMTVELLQAELAG